MDIHNAVGSTIGSSGGTNFQTRWLATMHTTHRQKHPLSIGTLADSTINHLPPGVTRHLIRLLADDGAGPAPKTLSQINRHSPMGHPLSSSDVSLLPREYLKLIEYMQYGIFL